MTLEVFSNSVDETLRIGEHIGRAAEPGLVVALKGNLGAGKTAMTKGIAAGLDVGRPEYVSSPTFTLHKIYEGRLTLHHLDLYRLGELGELEDMGSEEALAGDGVCVIEWPDFFSEEIPQDRLWVEFEIGEGELRRVTITSQGPLSDSVLARLEPHFSL